MEQQHNRKEYIQSVRTQIALQEQLLQNDKKETPQLNDHAWNSEYMRE